MVPGGARVARRAAAATGTSGATSPPTSREGLAFPDKRDEQLEPTTSRPGQYYLHRFYRFQPDLNIANPRRPRRDRARSWASGWRSASRASAWTPCPFLLETAGLPERHATSDPQRLAAPPARVRRPPPRRRDAARRGQRRAQGARAATSATRRRRAAHAVRLPAQPAACGWRSRAAQAEPLETRHPRAAGGAARQRVGDVPAQPRRADARQAHRPPARGGLRGVRPGARTCSSTATGCAAAPRRCSAATGDRLRLAWSLMFALPGHAGACSTATRSAWASNLAIADRYACACRCSGRDEAQRRLLDRRRRRLVRPLADGAFGPEHVNVADQRRDPGLAAEVDAAPDPRRRETPELGLGQRRR